MELSQSSSIRGSAAQVESFELSPTQERARKFWATQGSSWLFVAQTVENAVQLLTWLEGMQEKLQKTVATLREDPATVISDYQKMLSSPSYFYAATNAAHWQVLLGPRPIRKTPLHVVGPALDVQTQLQRLCRHFLKQASRIHVQLQSINEEVTSFKANELVLHRQLSLQLGRQARRIQKRVARVQSTLPHLSNQLSPEKLPQVLMCRRMLTLQTQRFRSLIRTADETSHMLRQYQRLQERAHSALFVSLVDHAADSQSPVYEYAFWVFIRGAIRSMHQWLMHPLIDTRDPSEPAA